MFEDDDDEDFSMSKSSKLSDIFGKLEDFENKQNTSLKYSAPKQPKKKGAMESKPSSKSTSSLGVVFTALVNAFKFEEGKYVHQGKLGLAILGNYELHNFILLMYRDKKNTITKVTINLHFNFIVQDNNYANFYDDRRVNWSVNFENIQQCQSFSQELCLAKFNSFEHHLESPIIQDLSIGSGSPVLLGDVIEAKYNCWFLTEHKLGAVFFSTNEKSKFLKVGDGELINGFDTGIQNVKRGGVRILILQAHHDKEAISSEFTIPEKCTVALKVEILEDKSTNKSSSPSPVPDKPSIASKPMLNSSGDDSSVKARCASLSEQLQNSPKSDKAKIISRMAKMGQPMVPVQNTVSSKLLSSESDTEEERLLQADVNPAPRPRVKTKSFAQKPDSIQGADISSINSGFAPSNNLANMFSTQSLALCQPQPMLSSLPSNQPIMPITQSAAPYLFLPGQPYMANTPHESHMPVLLSEVRTQNTEMRMQVSQMADKLERVLEKVGQTVVYPNMEVGTLSENIRRIFEENESLKGKMKEKDCKIEALSEKVNNLLQSNQIILEKSNFMLEQRSNQIQIPSLENVNRIALLEQEKSNLSDELTEAKKSAIDLKSKLENIENTNANLHKALEKLNDVNDLKENAQENCDLLKKEAEKLKSSLDIAVQKLNDKEKKCALLEKQLDLLTQESEHLKNLKVDYDKLLDQNTYLNNEIESLKTCLEVKKENSSPGITEKQPVQGPFIDEIKKVMNAVYRSLTKEFFTDQKYTSIEIKSILAAAIRQTTLDVIEHYSEKSNPIEIVKTIPLENKPTVDEAVVINESPSQKSDSGNSNLIKTVKAIPLENISSVGEAVVINESPPQKSVSESIITSTQKADQTGIITKTSDAIKQEEIKRSEPEESIKSTSDTDELDETFNEPWRPQPPPFFDESNSDEDDWLK